MVRVSATVVRRLGLIQGRWSKRGATPGPDLLRKDKSERFAQGHGDSQPMQHRGVVDRKRRAHIDLESIILPPNAMLQSVLARTAYSFEQPCTRFSSPR